MYMYIVVSEMCEIKLVPRCCLVKHKAAMIAVLNNYCMLHVQHMSPNYLGQHCITCTCTYIYNIQLNAKKVIKKINLKCFEKIVDVTYFVPNAVVY